MLLKTATTKTQYKQHSIHFLALLNIHNQICSTKRPKLGVGALGEAKVFQGRECRIWWSVRFRPARMADLRLGNGIPLRSGELARSREGEIFWSKCARVGEADVESVMRRPRRKSRPRLCLFALIAAQALFLPESVSLNVMLWKKVEANPLRTSTTKF
ncbi:hypothetical protein IWZ01DRAFT_499374 [Phyllosticta capitalensis]